MNDGPRATRARWGSAAAAVLLAAAANCGAADAPPPDVPAVLSAFVTDAAAPGAGPSWTAGDALPVTWESAGTVPADSWQASRGFTLRRAGSVTLVLGEDRVEGTLELVGTQDGVVEITLAWRQLSGPFDAAIAALARAGVTLTPLWCDRATEPATFGVALHAARFPGRPEVQLHETWNCGHDGCGYALTLRRRDARTDDVECVASAG